MEILLAKPKSKILTTPPSVSITFPWFEIAVKYPQPMRRAQAICNLNAHGEPQLNTRRSVGNDFVQRFTRHVLHDDVGFVL